MTPPPRWSQPEIDHLDRLAGNVPFPTLVRSMKHKATRGGMATSTRPVHKLSRLRCIALFTLAVRSARPSTVVACQHREHNSPRAPVWTMPQHWHVGRCTGGSRPALRSR